MNLALTVLAIIIWGWLGVLWVRRIKARREMERLSITPEALHELMLANHDVLVLDVRQPLDLLADSEIIAGAQRVSPQDATENPGIKSWLCTALAPVIRRVALSRSRQRRWYRISTNRESSFSKAAWPRGRLKGIRWCRTTRLFISTRGPNAMVGASPHLFRPTYAWGERGAPVFPCASD
jgi:hypothetical protein